MRVRIPVDAIAEVMTQLVGALLFSTAVLVTADLIAIILTPLLS